jgi:hypothetical protein
MRLGLESLSHDELVEEIEFLQNKTVSDQDMYILLLSALPCALHHQSYMHGLYVDIFMRYRDRLTRRQQEQAKREVEEEIRKHELLGTVLVDEDSHNNWKTFIRDLEQKWKEDEKSNKATSE